MEGAFLFVFYVSSEADLTFFGCSYLKGKKVPVIYCFLHVRSLTQVKCSPLMSQRYYGYGAVDQMFLDLSAHDTVMFSAAFPPSKGARDPFL